jgi:hypothetical protein
MDGPDPGGSHAGGKGTDTIEGVAGNRPGIGASLRVQVVTFPSFAPFTSILITAPPTLLVTTQLQWTDED